MKILLPVDGSELSLKAVRLAVDLLRQGLSGTLVLANVQEPATLYEMVVAPDGEVLRRVATAARRTRGQSLRRARVSLPG